MVPTWPPPCSFWNQVVPTAPQCPAVSTKLSWPLVTLKPAEQRPLPLKMAEAPFSLGVKEPAVRSICTKPPIPSATSDNSDQSVAETVLSACTTTLLDA